MGLAASAPFFVPTKLLTQALNVGTQNMVIVWDEPKRQANLVKHGIDFADIGPEFFLSARVVAANYDRWAAIGSVEGVIVVIFATLGTESISIISAKPASRRERRILS